MGGNRARKEEETGQETIQESFPDLKDTSSSTEGPHAYSTRNKESPDQQVSSDFSEYQAGEGDPGSFQTWDTQLRMSRN